MRVLPLLSVPVIIGLVAAAASGSGEFIFIAFGVGLLVVLGAISVSSSSNKSYLLHPDRDTPLESGFFEQDGRSGGFLHADGFTFEMRSIGGKLNWREVDPTSKKPLERWIRSHERDLRGEKRVMAESIKTRVNRRKGL